MKTLDNIIREKYSEIKRYTVQKDIDIYNCNTSRIIDYIEEDMTQRVVPKADEQTKIFIRVLLDAMDSFEAKPSNINVFKTVYAFPKANTWSGIVKNEDFDFHESQTIYVNKDELWVRTKIVPMICQLCQEYRYEVMTSTEYPINKTKSVEKTRFLLLGERGQGKTFFINYITTACKDIFDQQKVIYIRYDFNKLINYFKDDIEDIFLYQSIRIVRLYYSSHLDSNLEERNKFEEFLHRKAEERSKTSYSKDEVDSYIKAYFNITDTTTKINIGNASRVDILNWFYEIKGWTFLFVFDGLDILGLRENHKKKFLDFCTQTIERVFWEHSMPGVYIVAMRHVSFEYLCSIIPDDGRHTLRTFRQLRIVNPDLMDVLSRRSSLACKLKDIQSKILPQDKRIDFIKHCVIKRVLELLLDRIFKALIVKYESEYAAPIKTQDINKQVLEHLFNNNMRSFLLFLRHLLVYYFPTVISGSCVNVTREDFLKQLESGVYRDENIIIEELVRGPTVWPLPKYRYQLHPKFGIEYVKNESSRSFLPNVFNYIDIAYNSRLEIHLLTKIRLVQYLISCGTTSRYKLLNEIRKYFGFDELLINHEIEESISLGLLSIVYGSTGAGQNYSLVASSLGKNIVENLMYNFSYLRYVSGSTPLPNKLIGLLSPNNDEDNYPVYLNFKNCITRVIAFIGYVYVIENLEISECNIRSKPVHGRNVKLYDFFLEAPFNKIWYKLEKASRGALSKCLTAARRYNDVEFIDSYDSLFKLESADE